MSGVSLGNLLPSVGHYQRDQCPGAGHCGEDQLQHPNCVVQCGCPVVAVPGHAQQHHASQASPARPITAAVKLTARTVPRRHSRASPRSLRRTGS